ncbi:MAG: hypothetical protein A3D65_02605 [Candidatus Lloydbacteria bacterium RIFCSPHIGHO2_02_FULL_50_13]|uniref:Uncharacterized protein n=1 Tax=Candidatus Lloydbacteria bacterium RIFCSPHIGHO2_02_FULL_50_13 TaxID=1798661 RepID=A0A1G2D433_9BACT|nr:MAG: hypothetical protein A3D65_02605 [Candidatus Lloydbacteria bacterium RIFCSPHIGHO2_02_FULL_50_13]
MMLWHHVALQNIFPCKISSFWNLQKDLEQALKKKMLRPNASETDALRRFKSELALRRAGYGTGYNGNVKK